MELGRLGSFAVIVLCAGAALVRAHAAAPPAATPPAAYAWDEKFMTAPPRELLAAAKGVDAPDAGYVVLFEERVHTFDADGANRARYRRVYKILDESALGGDGLSVSWAPWHEAEPRLRARVTTREGKAFALDPKTIETSGVRGGDADTFTDRRQLRAPLPGLAVGAIVEEEVVSESKPILPGLGSASTFSFGDFATVQRSRLVLEAPRSVPLHVIERPAGALRATRTEIGDRIRLVYEVGLLPGTDEPGIGWPDDVPVLPQVHYSTTPSWRDVAARYADIVERQIAGADLRTWVEEARKGTGKTREELIARLVARLHREVRYTGIEFGDASIAPRKPAEVLARGYGDCKDKAALLVAVLRAAGVPAEVALLKVTGLDVDPRVPSLDTFDHAIVHVPPAGKSAALWIDATNPYAPVGELPGGDAGRQALLANARSAAPVTTPVAAAGQSVIRETRRVVLGESGHPRVFERTEAQGAAARGFRAVWSTTARKDLEEQLTAYVKQQYRAKSLIHFDIGTLTDLTKPPRLDLEIADAEIGRVWDDGADVTIRSWPTLEHLPAPLRTTNDDAARARKPRTVDFEMGDRYRYELRYEIVPPHGFAADSLPEESTRALGTASLRSTYAVDARGTVSAMYTFDSGKKRLSPQEFERFRADVKTFSATDAPTVRFHANGAVALDSGKVREALAIFRKLDGEHPRQALHARQIAEAVLMAGLGQVARDEAKRALVVDPKSADGERMLGWTLEHDLIGRRFKDGADLAGAEKAYRRAIALDPKHVSARASLAILLEHDATGQRSYPEAHLAEAEKLYDGIEKDGDQRFALNHTIVLLYLQRFKTVIERAQAAGNQDAELLAAMAASQGAPAALRAAATRLAGSQQRVEQLRTAGVELMRLRRYSEAGALYEEAARDNASGAALRVFAERIRRARRHETVKLDPRKPGDVARAVFIQMFQAAADNRLPSKSALAPLATSALVDDLASNNGSLGVRGLTRSLARSAGGVPMVAVADMLAGAEFDTGVEGKPGLGYRVRLSPAEGTGVGLRFLLRGDSEGPRLVGIGEDRPTLAREVLRLRRAGRLEAARTWLDWALETETLGSPADPLSGSLLARVWSSDETNRSADDIDVAAAVLLAGAAPASLGMAEAIPILEKARAGAGAGADARRVAWTLALADALRTAGRNADAEPLTAELQKRFPRSVRALGLRFSVLYALGRKPELLGLTQANLTARPDDPDALRYLARAQQALARLADAEATFARVAGSPKATASDHNMVAWIRLCRGDTGDATLASARRAAELSGHSNPAILHTLAAVLAERDEPEKAHDVLIQSLDRRPGEEVRSDDRYVLGRIAEAQNFPDTARELYRSLPRPTGDVETSSYTLAQRRLARLDGRAAPTTPTAKPPAH